MFKPFQILHPAKHFTYLPQSLFIEYFCVSRDQQGCAEADRDPQNISDPRKDCGSFVDEKLRALRRRNLDK